MLEILYHIDRIESEKKGLLVVKLLEGNPSHLEKPISLSRWQQLATPKDQHPLRILTLNGVKFEHSSLHIPYSQSVQALKFLAPSGKLFLNHKKLICDLFTKVEFYYLVKNSGVKGMLKYLDQEFDLACCDFLCSGSNSWFVRGNILKIIDTHVSWKNLKQLFVDASQFSLKHLQDSDHDETPPRIVQSDNSLEVFQHEQQPLPLLILKDRSGAFADLWMDYGHATKYPFHDLGPHENRDFNVEKNWEKDLLETGFIKKNVGNSHYYCPLDEVAKSLTFLLEIGWRIQDYQKKKVLLMNNTDFEFSIKDKDIFIRGSFKYSEYEADLKNVAGAFNRRERFVQMGPEAVGLLPEKWRTGEFSGLFEECEIVENSLKIKRCLIGTLDNLFKYPEKLSLDQALNKLQVGLSTITEIPTVQPGSAFQGTLRPYQQQGVNWLNFLHHYGFNGILADDMGLGKTVQVLAFLSQLNQTKPVLIVMPTSLIFNWKKEIERFLPERRVVLYQGLDRSLKDLKIDEIVLTTYATMRIDLKQLLDCDFEAIILDEAQAIKNPNTHVAQAAYQLKSSFRLLLTGTPIENHLGEIWSHFRFLMPELLGDEKSFQADLQASHSDGRYLQKIKKKIRPFILRRKKSEVAKDLPDCIEQMVWLEMLPSQRQIYESFLASIKNRLLTKVSSDGISKHRMEIFEAILRLRQICCHPLLISGQLPDDTSHYESGKMEALMQDLENVIEENNKVLVYSQFTSMLSLIAKEIKNKNWKYAYLDGSTKEREKAVTQFQEDPHTHLFLISLKAGGMGLNLTSADHVFIFDPWWNEAAEKQAINRAHRIGRKTTVFAKRYAMSESIEEKMMKLKERKKWMIDTILDDEALFTQLTTEDFAYLLS